VVFVPENDKTHKPKYYNVADIQELLGIGRNSAYKLVTANGFPSIYVGNRIIIPADRFDQWVDEQVSVKGGVADG
jgi:excisionase family DNA binding protein